MAVRHDQETSKQVHRNVQGELHRVSEENERLREELMLVKKDLAAVKHENLETQHELGLMMDQWGGMNRDICAVATQNKEFGRTVAQLKQVMTSFWCTYLKQVSATPSGKLPTIYRYGDFGFDLENDRGRYSPSFYTSFNGPGYNLCIKTFPDGLKWEGWMTVTYCCCPAWCL